jgi:MurNAc alpha-1-phosphate uridylyltransferase
MFDDAPIPDKAFILAAGLGTRMRPLTNDIPKPMVEVKGKPMIDHALDTLKAVGVQTCVVNTHYKASVLEQHLKNRKDPEIIISHEEELLDTGGGITKMIRQFKKPFFILSGDSMLEDESGEALKAMANEWNSDQMDILILLQPVSSMHLTQGVGDYNLGEDGRAVRSLDRTGQYMFTSIRINSPEIFNECDPIPFSYLELLDIAQGHGRLFGLVHDGIWHHISTPEDVEKVNAS